jgi:hypothetical protein
MTNESNSIADYSNEEPTKVLNSYSLIEAIHEYFDPTENHDSEYLQMRIKLLREVFDLGEDSKNINAETITKLLTGYGRICPISILPFEGALEVPNSIDTEAHIEIEKQFKSELSDIRNGAYKIQRAYITYIIIHAIEGRLRSKSVTLSDLIASGLPQADPGYDEMDY